ncbi:hypothetical protein LX36DRAFT_750341 [Colletotrichum falcatum]|nr:hypothetical protein LX36DRAFT_750341 [Colletotrichum falcatum]
MVVLGLLSTNVAGGTKRSVASGSSRARRRGAPAYRNGIVAMLCGFALNLVLNQVLRLMYAAENTRRNGLLEGKSQAEIAGTQREDEVLGFEDVTDRANDP